MGVQTALLQLYGGCSTCGSNDQIVPRKGGFTNAFYSNLNTSNLKNFSKTWQDIARTI